MTAPYADVSFLYDPRSKALVQYVKLPTGQKFCIYDPQTATRKMELTEDRDIHEIKLGTRHAVLLLTLLFRKRVWRWGKKIIKSVSDKELHARVKQQVSEAGENAAQQVDRFFKNPPSAIGSLIVNTIRLPIKITTFVTSTLLTVVVPEASESETPRVPPKQTRREVQMMSPEEMEALQSIQSGLQGGMQGLGLGKSGALDEAGRAGRKGPAGMGGGWLQASEVGKGAPGQSSGAAIRQGGGPAVGGAEGLQEYLAHLMRQGMFGGPVMLPDPDLDMDPEPDFGDGPLMDDPDPDFDLDEDEDEYEDAF